MPVQESSSGAALLAPLMITATGRGSVAGSTTGSGTARPPLRRVLRMLSVCGDACAILAAVYFVPVVVLAVGVPIAFVVRLLLRLAGIL